MANEPIKSVVFDAANLTEAQADGLACVACGADYMTADTASVPVGTVRGSQVFACESCTESPDDDIAAPMDAAHKVDVLAEIINDLLVTIVNDGRLTLAEERTWRAATDAVVLDRPELMTPSGQVVDEAERILRAV